MLCFSKLELRKCQDPMSYHSLWGILVDYRNIFIYCSNEWMNPSTNEQTNRQTNKQLNICCLQTLHELATGRSRGRLKLMSYLRLEISVSARYRWANIVFEESWLTTGMYCLMKWKIGLVGQFINPSTNKQTNKQIGTQKKVPEISVMELQAILKKIYLLEYVHH